MTVTMTNVVTTTNVVTNITHRTFIDSVGSGGGRQIFAYCQCRWIGPKRPVETVDRGYDPEYAKRVARLDGGRHMRQMGQTRRQRAGKITRPRDSQRSKLYAAEREAFTGRCSAPDWDHQFATLDECQEYVDRLTSERWFQSRWGHIHIPVVSGSGSNASYRGRVMLSTYGRRPWVILHEVAHWLISDSTVAAHGPQFAACYLLLVEKTLGDNAANQLRAAFVNQRVRHRTGTAALPKPGTYPVVTKTATVTALRAAAKRPVTAQEAARAAEVLRRAARTGVFGPSTSKPRSHALAAARRLDGIG